jgi:hypothetical protein
MIYKSVGGIHVGYPVAREPNVAHGSYYAGARVKGHKS